ncbi:MAG: hypothetical protein M0Q54_04350 [Pigmentiphaga sp.]|nr:hypothetical protein [Pigmentiphaga sp.]
MVTNPSARKGIDEAKDKAKDMIEEGREAAKRTVDDVSDKASDYTDRAARLSHRAGDKLENALEEGCEMLEDGRDAVAECLRCTAAQIRERPITAMAIVAGVAYLLGRFRR